ncbi:MAG TPA: CU044_2847 family protein [Terracidiphilus sp.]|nr:CU044_2847 family protein [Terracidiphilus sp.]
MSHHVTFRLESGESFAAEVDDPIEDHKTVRGLGARTELIIESSKTFEAAIQNVQRAAEVLVDRLRSLSRKPDEVSVEFGVKLSAEAGAIVAKASTDANFKITLKWKGNEGT